MNAGFCRVEGVADSSHGLPFVTMIVYLLGALVCLKLWRHEALETQGIMLSNRR